VLSAPATGEPLPRYTSIGIAEVDRFVRSLLTFRVLYFDRLSLAIFELVRWAKGAGAVTLFEPSEIGDLSLFKAVQPFVDVLKFSAERLSLADEALQDFANPVQVITKGSEGLTLRTNPTSGRLARIDLPAEIPEHVVDTAGAGDAVSTALVRAIVTSPVTVGLPPTNDLVHGLRAGQHLASLNCSFVGARGAFRSLPACDLLQELRDGAAWCLPARRSLTSQPAGVAPKWMPRRSALESRYG
jgi:fructokinase